MALDKIIFDQQRDKLLNLFGYETKRLDGKESILYLKVNFILNNSFPDDEDDAKAAMLMLISDCNILFKDIDREYRHGMLNRPDRRRKTINEDERKKLNKLTRAYYEESYETADRFTSYLKRLSVLSDLRAGYEQYEVSGSGPFYDLPEIKTKPVSESASDIYDTILKRVIHYCTALDRDRRHSEHTKVTNPGGAKRGLCWCIERVFGDCIKEHTFPITLLQIIHYAGRGILRADTESLLGLEFRPWISKDNHYQERVQQLIFLNGLFTDFNYSTEARQKNLSDYLKVWGVAILSKEEQQLWRRWSESDITIPAIEFQLRLHDYWKECLPLNLDTLYYSPASKLHLWGLYDFYQSVLTEKEIEKYSRQLETDDTFLKHRDLYLQMMGKPISLKEKVDLLCDMDEIQLGHLKVSFHTNGVDADELRRLLRETILRMSLRRKALAKLSQEAERLWGIRLSETA